MTDLLKQGMLETGSRSSPITGLMYAVVPSLLLWAVIVAAIWFA